MFDIDSFLQNVYDLCARNKSNTKALDLIYETMAMRSLEDMPYDLMNEIQSKVDVEKLSPTCALAFLMMTFKYSEVVPNHIVLFEKTKDYFYSLGKTDQEVKGLLSGLEGVGNYWESMKAYGAPEWLAGHNPNK